MIEAEKNLKKLPFTSEAGLPTATGSRTLGCTTPALFGDNREWEDTLHSLFLSISYEPKSPFKLWRSDRVLTRESFLDMIPTLPGVLSDRLFSAFDLDNSGTIDFNEFLEGLHAMGETTEKKLAFLHRMYDLNGDGLVSKQEFLMMLNHMIGGNDADSAGLFASPEASATCEAALCAPDVSCPRAQPPEPFDQVQTLRPHFNGGGALQAGVENLVHSTLPSESCTLDFPSFAKLLQTEPTLQRILENFCYHTMPKILPFYTAYLGSTSFNGGLRSGCRTTNCTTRLRNGSLASPELRSYVQITAGARMKSLELSSPFNFCGWLSHKHQIYFAILKDKYLLLYRDPNEFVPSKAICLIGAVLPKRARRRIWQRRHNDADRGAPTPGTCERPDILVVDDQYLAAAGVAADYKYAFELYLARGLKNIDFATNSLRDRGRWLRVISDVLEGKLSDFHEHYLLKGQVGRGRFGTVFSAQHRQTGVKVAVKIMRRPPSDRLSSTPHGVRYASAHTGRRRDWFKARLTRCYKFTRAEPSASAERLRRSVTCKWVGSRCRRSRLASKENIADLRVLQRTEVSVLRLLNHQNIVKLLEVFYSADFIYIIMPWSPAGDLKGLLDGLLAVNRVLLGANAQRKTRIAEQVAEGHYQRSKSLPRLRELAPPVCSPVPHTARPAVHVPGVQPDVTGVDLVWIPDQVCQTLLRGISRGLSYLHSKLRNVVHRDIKPDNILLDLQIEDLINDVIQCAEARKRRKTLAQIQGKPQAPLTSSPALLSAQGAAVASTAVPSMASKSFEPPAPVISRPDLLAVDSSDVSSAVDTIDQYLVDTPYAYAGRRQTSRQPLGAVEEDAEFLAAQRRSSAADEHLNAWLFLNVLLWLYKDRQAEEFLDLLSAGEVYASPWLPSNLYEHLTTEDLMSLIMKHTHPRITDFGLSKILAPLEPNTPARRVAAAGGLSTHAVEPMGTEAYAAPEVKSGTGYTTSADMWSLGVVTYQLLSTGFFPSVDGTAQCPGSARFAGLQCRGPLVVHFVPSGLWAGVPEEAKEFVRALMQIEPDARPSAEVCLTLPWLAGAPVSH